MVDLIPEPGRTVRKRRAYREWVAASSGSRRRKGMTVVLAALTVLAACGGDTAPTTEPPGESTTVATSFRLPETEPDVNHVEMIAADDGRLLLAWTTRGTSGGRLWLATITEGSPGDPFLVATNATDIPLEEMRPSLAVGPDDRVAVGWTSVEMDVYLALSEDGGATFGTPPFRLNLEPRGMQVLPVIAFDPNGGVHAVWLDPRDAPEHAEEPAELYMGILSDDQYLETNLTEGQGPSVCGCCRPHIEMRAGEPLITFRNTTADGYRDPYQLTPDDSPTAVAPATWQIEACPVAGPVAVGAEVLWFDGSAGHARVLASNGPETPPDVLLESGDGHRITAGPRLVTGAAQPLVLVPGSPASRLLSLDGETWSEVDIELPEWVTTAVVSGGDLIVVGQEGGRLVSEVHALD